MIITPENADGTCWHQLGIYENTLSMNQSSYAVACIQEVVLRQCFHTMTKFAEQSKEFRWKAWSRLLQESLAIIFMFCFNLQRLDGWRCWIMWWSHVSRIINPPSGDYIILDLQKFHNICTFGLLHVWAVLTVPRKNWTFQNKIEQAFPHHIIIPLNLG